MISESPVAPPPSSGDQPPRTDLVQVWRAVVDRHGDRVCLSYFGATLTFADVEDASDALAVELQARGVLRGDRVGLYLQNTPAFVLGLLALWKCGAAAVLLNPMYRRAELRKLVDDAQASGVICSSRVVSDLRLDLADGSVGWYITSDDHDFQGAELADGVDGPPRPDASDELVSIVRSRSGQRPREVESDADSVALLTYTSGTTGPSKGAMNTHANILAVVATNTEWLGLGSDDVVLAVAPLFHITGVVVNATIALLNGAELVLLNRFRAEEAADALARRRVTYTIGSITAFNAITALPEADPTTFASMRLLYSGGAPIPPATVERFHERFGVYIHNAYGMTETTSAVISVPPGQVAPVHEASGTLSIGLPLPGVNVRIVDEVGTDVAPGTQGELAISGPQVIPGYWQKPAETALAFPLGELRTGDGAIMDEQGWVYLVDRLKDQINVSGYKVWPREVEDALYENEAVHEAAVVSRPDDYQGESVVAYVALREGHSVDPAELVAFVRDRLAAYKVPREVHILGALPKTLTGKIRRNVLRDQETRE